MSITIEKLTSDIKQINDNLLKNSVKVSNYEQQHLEFEKSQEETKWRACAEFYKTIDITQELRREITADIKAQKDSIEILLKAIECIAVITNNNEFYEKNRLELEKQIENK